MPITAEFIGINLFAVLFTATGLWGAGFGAMGLKMTEAGLAVAGLGRTGGAAEVGVGVLVPAGGVFVPAGAAVSESDSSRITEASTMESI